MKEDQNWLSSIGPDMDKVKAGVSATAKDVGKRMGGLSEKLSMKSLWLSRTRDDIKDLKKD